MRIKKFNDKLNEQYDQAKNLQKVKDLSEVMTFLQWVVADIQFANDENYLGFINLSIDNFSSTNKDVKFSDRVKGLELKNGLTACVNLYNSDKNMCKQLLTYLGLEIEPNPTLEETVIHSIV